MMFEQRLEKDRALNDCAFAAPRAPLSAKPGGKTPRRPVPPVKQPLNAEKDLAVQCFEAPGRGMSGADERSERAFKQPDVAYARRNDTGIPDAIKQRFENLSGFSLDDVRVHYNSRKPAQLQALAYTQGDRVYMAPGQEKHLPHELGHVVQQKQGRVAPLRSIGGLPVNDSPALEREADALAAASAARGEAIIQRRADGDVVQRHVEATISAAGITQKTVSSGNAREAKAEIEGWGEIKEEFDKVQSVDYPVSSRFEALPEEEERQEEQSGSESAPQATYPRNRYMCAEPFAFASALKAHRESSLNSYAVTRDWLASIRISEVTDFCESGKRRIKPCSVCSQWLEEAGADDYSIRPAFIPAGGSEHGAAKAEYLRRRQLEQDARERMERRERERAAEAEREERELNERFGAALASGKAAFTDDSGRIKEGLERAFELANVRYVSGLHERAWAGIVCEDSLPEFVQGARGYWSQLERDVNDFEQMKPNERRLFKKNAKPVLERYSLLCEEMADAKKKRTVLSVVQNYMLGLDDKEERDQLRESMADMDREVGAQIYDGPDEEIIEVSINEREVQFYFEGGGYYGVDLR